MRSIALETPIAQLVNQRPARSRVFERLGIDYCCGGRRTLAEACRDSRVSAETVLAELEAFDLTAPAEQAIDLEGMTIGGLIDHIVTTHHDYIRRELPRLMDLIRRVVEAHSGRHPELLDVREVFLALRVELEMHMLKEERVLFPLARQLEAAVTLPSLPRGGVNQPIRALEHEHEQAELALTRLRRYTSQFRPPLDACDAYRQMLAGLARFESDMHQHMHKENNVLFVRLAELQERVTAAAKRN